jgi:translocation and assembly module TamB
VLAQLVFGRSIDNLSPVQIAQLAAAAAQLAGLSGSDNLLETLRARTGLDDIDVRTDEATGESSVAAGKYLNDRTYVTIERGTDAGSGKAAIDLELGRGLKLRGEAHEDGEAKGGLFFEREY